MKHQLVLRRPLDGDLDDVDAGVGHLVLPVGAEVPGGDGRGGPQRESPGQLLVSSDSLLMTAASSAVLACSHTCEQPVGRILLLGAECVLVLQSHRPLMALTWSFLADLN